MLQSLSNISDGTAVIVKEIQQSDLKVKLLEMGIVEGKVLEVQYRAPFGDPLAIDVGGYTLSIRKDEAKSILVEQISTEE